MLKTDHDSSDLSKLEREVEELEAAAMAAEVEDKRMRELCGQYSGSLSYKRSVKHKAVIEWE